MSPPTRTVLLVLLACSSHFRLAKSSPIACEAAGVDASCEPAANGSPGCDGADRIRHHEESDRCWPSARLVFFVIDSFSITKTVGSCPAESYNFGDCVDKVDTHEDSGVHHQVQDLKIGYEPVNLYTYNITVRWTYQDNNPSPAGVKAYRLKVTGGPDIPFPLNCVCINSSLNLTEYSFTIDYTKPLDSMTANMFTFPYADGVDPALFQVETSSKVPTTCADFETGLPYDSSTCGLPLYGKPKNVTKELRGTSTVLSWEKPCFRSSGACDLFDYGLFYISPEIYYLTLTDNNEVEYNFRVSKATKVTLNTFLDLHVKVFAYVPCSGLYEYHSRSIGYGNGCSSPGEEGDRDELDEAMCCSILSPVMPTFMFTPTPSPTTPSPIQISPIGPATIFLVILIPVLTAALCVIVWCYVKRRCHRKLDSVPYVPVRSVSVPNVSALIISSPRNSQLETQAIMHSLVTVLRNSFGIESHIPELDLPRENLFDWISNHHEKAHAVFCVCNKNFYEEWNQTANLENYLKVVYCFKTLFEGAMDSDKYAVVLTDSIDRVYIPPLLRSRRTFAIDDYQGMAHFARNIPRFSSYIPAAAAP